jgi:hypothetical protein
MAEADLESPVIGKEVAKTSEPAPKEVKQEAAGATAAPVKKGFGVVKKPVQETVTESSDGWE